jgi:hypothetical protein
MFKKTIFFGSDYYNGIKDFIAKDSNMKSKYQLK